VGQAFPPAFLLTETRPKEAALTILIVFQSQSRDRQGAVISGTLNGQPFLSIEDADPRIGARLEVFAGDSYMWLAFDQIASIEMRPPQKLRDLLWAPATIHTAEGFEGADLGEVLLPVLSPFSSAHADDLVRLGRMTVWEGEAPFGQKMLLVDDEEIPLLDIRSLEISRPVVN
jgi:type VI secretion system protein ImpE